MQAVVNEGNPTPYKEFGKFAHGLFDDPVQIVPPQYIVGAAALEPEVSQRHVRVLFNLKQFRLERCALRVVQFLQQQVHRRNRRLDLVQPQRIVIEHLAHAAVGGRCNAAFLIVYCLDQILVVLLEQIFRRRQSV